MNDSLNAGKEKRRSASLTTALLLTGGLFLLSGMAGCGNSSNTMSVSGGPQAITFCPSGCTYSNNNNNSNNPYGQLTSIDGVYIDGQNNVWIPDSPSGGGVQLLEIPAGNPGGAISICPNNCTIIGTTYLSGYSPVAYAADPNSGTFWILEETSNGGTSYDILKIPAGLTSFSQVIQYPLNTSFSTSGVAMAVDIQDNIWIAHGGQIYEIPKGNLSTSSTSVSTSPTYTSLATVLGSTITATGIAVDETHQLVWIAGTGGCSGNCNSTGNPSVLAQYTIGTATPAHVFCNFTNTGCVSTNYSKLDIYTSLNGPPYQSGGRATGPANTNSIVLDSSGNLWVSLSANTGVMEVPYGNVSSPVFCINGCNDGGTFGGGTPAGIAIDHQNRAWVAGTFGNSNSSNSGGFNTTIASPSPGGGASAFSGTSAQVQSYASYCDFSVINTNLMGCSAFNSFMFPTSIAVDSNGNVWIANNGFNSAALSNSNSGSSSNSTNGWVTELVGAAK